LEATWAPTWGHLGPWRFGTLNISFLCVSRGGQYVGFALVKIEFVLKNGKYIPGLRQRNVSNSDARVIGRSFSPEYGKPMLIATAVFWTLGGKKFQSSGISNTRIYLSTRSAHNTARLRAQTPTSPPIYTWVFLLEAMAKPGHVFSVFYSLHIAVDWPLRPLQSVCVLSWHVPYHAITLCSLYRKTLHKTTNFDRSSCGSIMV